jgi:hypothetical protein
LHQRRTTHAPARTVVLAFAQVDAAEKRSLRTYVQAERFEQSIQAAKLAVFKDQSESHNATDLARDREVRTCMCVARKCAHVRASFLRFERACARSLSV